MEDLREFYDEKDLYEHARKAWEIAIHCAQNEEKDPTLVEEHVMNAWKEFSSEVLQIWRKGAYSGAKIIEKEMKDATSTTTKS
jgi:hypothetical protein